MNFEWVDQVLKEEFGLVRKEISGNRYNYHFKDRFLNNKKSNVIQQVIQLKNGGVGGYVYVGHLSEYDGNEKRHKDGYMNIGHFTEIEFKELIKKVTQGYK